MVNNANCQFQSGISALPVSLGLRDRKGLFSFLVTVSIIKPAGTSTSSPEGKCAVYHTIYHNDLLLLFDLVNQLLPGLNGQGQAS